MYKVHPINKTALIKNQQNEICLCFILNISNVIILGRRFPSLFNLILVMFFKLYQIGKANLILCFLLIQSFSSQSMQITIILLSALFYSTLQFNTIITSQACQYPLIIEYLTSASLPSNDLRDIIKIKVNSPLPLKNITNSQQATTFSSILFKPIYSGTYKNVSKISDNQILISNDSFVGDITFVAEVAKAVGKNTYNVSISSMDVKMTYTKSYNFNLNKFVLSNFVIQYENDWLNNTSIIPEPTKATDKTKIQKIINNELSDQLKLQINTIKLWMSDFTQSTNIGAIYPEGNYSYDFYSFREQIDMNSMGVQTQTKESQTILVNKLKGQIKNSPNNECPSSPKATQMNQYSQFITLQFIKNIASTQNIQGYKPWQSIDVNRTWMRTVNFQWKLVDLEFLLPEIVQKYQQYYMNEIKFICQYVKTNNISLSEEDEQLDTSIDWSCKGYIVQNDNISLTQFINVSLTINHALKIWVSSSLSVYSDILKLHSVTFTADGQQIQVDKKLAETYIEETFNDMRTYVIGTYFRVKEGAKNVAFDADPQSSGIWIG